MAEHPGQQRQLLQLGRQAQAALRQGDWAGVRALGSRILKLDAGHADGHVLLGLAAKAGGQPDAAAKAFSRALRSNPQRADAAVELAGLMAASLRHGEAVGLLQRSAAQCAGQPGLLAAAAAAYSRMGLHQAALPLYQQALALQPEAEQLQANLAACSVFTGNIEHAISLYQGLLQQFPQHQRYHFQLSRLITASDETHVQQMRSVLENSTLPPEGNIFLHYALGKELEDLGHWDQAFYHYQQAGDAAAAAAAFDVATDVALVAAVSRVCDAAWLAQDTAKGAAKDVGQAAASTSAAGADSRQPFTPVFVVGLPRTGTTLVDRILSSHSQVQSLDETHMVEVAIRRLAGAAGQGAAGDLPMPVATLEAAATAGDVSRLAADYQALVACRRTGGPLAIDKLPGNLLHLGFIHRAWPKAPLISLRRHPMDACFAMYKQSFFRFAYTLADVGRYYIAMHQLQEHWRATLGGQLLEVHYEDLTRNQEAVTRRMLEHLGVPFESQCLQFQHNTGMTATASAAQVREPMHQRSVGRWRHFARQLAPLQAMLEAAGIRTEGP